MNASRATKWNFTAYILKRVMKILDFLKIEIRFT